MWCLKQYSSSLTYHYLLMPISLMANDGGPTKMTPSLSHKSANSVFSDKNPYPGWIACWQMGANNGLQENLFGFLQTLWRNLKKLCELLKLIIIILGEFLYTIHSSHNCLRNPFRFLDTMLTIARGFHYVSSTWFSPLLKESSWILGYNSHHCWRVPLGFWHIILTIAGWIH